MISQSKSQTQSIAAKLAKKILNAKRLTLNARIIALQGELGSGKTAFTQGFCRALGVRHGVASPTFIIFRKHPISKPYTLNPKPFSNVYHFDLYRLRKPKELLHLGFKKIIRDPQNIVLIEWPELVKKLLPKNTIWIKFGHGKKDGERNVKINNW